MFIRINLLVHKVLYCLVVATVATCNLVSRDINMSKIAPKSTDTSTS